MDPLTLTILTALTTSMATKAGETCVEKGFFLKELKRFFSKDPETLDKLEKVSSQSSTEQEFVSLQMKINELLKDKSIRDTLSSYQNNTNIQSANDANQNISFSPTINVQTSPNNEVPSSNIPGVDTTTNNNYPAFYKQLGSNHASNVVMIDQWLNYGKVTHEEYDSLMRASQGKHNLGNNSRNMIHQEGLKLSFEELSSKIDEYFEIGAYKRMEDYVTQVVENKYYTPFIAYYEVGSRYQLISDFKKAVLFLEKALGDIDQLEGFSFSEKYYIYSDLAEAYHRIHYYDKELIILRKIESYVDQLGAEQKLFLYASLEANQFLTSDETKVYKEKRRELCLEYGYMKIYYYSFINEATIAFRENREDAKEVKKSTDIKVKKFKNCYSIKAQSDYYLCNYYSKYYMQIEKNYELTKKYHTKQLEISKKLRQLSKQRGKEYTYISKREIGHYYSNFAFLEYAFKHFDEALKYSNQATKLFNKYNDDLDIGGGYQSIGYLFYLIGKVQLRDEYTQRALHIFKLYEPHAPYSLVAVYRNLVEFNIKDEDYDIARKYLKLVINTINTHNLKEYDDILYFTSKLSEHSKNHEPVLHCKQNFSLTHDEFYEGVERYRRFLPVENL